MFRRNISGNPVQINAQNSRIPHFRTLCHKSCNHSRQHVAASCRRYAAVAGYVNARCRPVGLSFLHLQNYGCVWLLGCFFGEIKPVFPHFLDRKPSSGASPWMGRYDRVQRQNDSFCIARMFSMPSNKTLSPLFVTCFINCVTNLTVDSSVPKS